MFEQFFFFGILLLEFHVCKFAIALAILLLYSLANKALIEIESEIEYSDALKQVRGES